jgi:hypothetical protein
MPLTDQQAAAVASDIVDDMAGLCGDAPDDVDRKALMKVVVKRIYDAVAANLTATVSGATATGPFGGPLNIVAQPVAFDPPEE